jgi:hypothetical protein
MLYVQVVPDCLSVHLSADFRLERDELLDDRPRMVIAFSSVKDFIAPSNRSSSSEA